MPVIDQPSALLRLCALVSELTALPAASVLLGYGDRPRPATAHIEVRPLADTGLGLPARNAADNVKHAREVAVLMTAYGQPAVDALRSMSVLLWSDAAEMFDAVDDGLAIRAVSPVADQTAIKASSYEPRASMTVTVGYVASHAPASPPDADGITVEVIFNDDELGEVVDQPNPPPGP